MFRTVLIANRGEIACRIAATLKRMGIRAVAVHSAADADAPHVHEADVGVPIGPAPAAQSYLDAGAILDAARRCGAEAIHPGYGFLSENPAFAQAVADAGFRWIGPPAGVIARMGDKAAARRAAVEVGVPVVPGSDDASAAGAEGVGYPLLVKAAGGGGGIGMQVVTRPDKLDKAVQACRERGRASFRHDGVYLERLIEPCHHVEVQVLCDGAGALTHLSERECSVQRRRQKVIEESPSPAVERLGGAFRQRLCDAAVALARHVGYENAGTVEFVVDPGDPSSGRAPSLHFIEMNTRLQVEHAVTEERYDLDLVEAQIRIAAGETLHSALDGRRPGADLRPEGHAMELRIYAEDPARMFLPSPGRLAEFAFPPWPSLRHDMGYRRGQEVTPHYDPLLGKLITVAEDRATAVERLSEALFVTRVEGIASNVALLRAILIHEDFAAGRTPTSWLEATLPTLL